MTTTQDNERAVLTYGYWLTLQDLYGAGLLSDDMYSAEVTALLGPVEGRVEALARVERVATRVVNDHRRRMEEEEERGLKIILAWAERDPVIAEAMRVVDEGQAGDLDEVDRYLPCVTNRDEWQDAGVSPEYMDALTVLAKCVERGLP